MLLRGSYGAGTPEPRRPDGRQMFNSLLSPIRVTHLPPGTATPPLPQPPRERQTLARLVTIAASSRHGRRRGKAPGKHPSSSGREIFLTCSRFPFARSPPHPQIWPKFSQATRNGKPKPRSRVQGKGRGEKAPNPTVPAGSLFLLSTKSLRESWDRIPAAGSSRGRLFACKRAAAGGCFVFPRRCPSLGTGEGSRPAFPRGEGQLGTGSQAAVGQKSCSSAT